MTGIDLEKHDYIRAFMSQRPVDFARAALIVADMQYATGAREGALGRKLRREGSNVADYRFQRIESLVVPNTRRLLDAFHGKNGRVVYLTIGARRADAADAPPRMREFFRDLENYEGSPNHEIIEQLRPKPGDFVLNKTSIGAFASTGIDSLLRSLGCEQLYLCGGSTNMCVGTTAREAADRGYLVTLVEDACGTTLAELHEATLTNFQRLFGRVRSIAEVLEEIASKH